MSRKIKPQDDVPVDVIIHYIVKDYRRMFEENETLKRRIKVAENKAEEEREMALRVQEENRKILKNQSLCKAAEALREAAARMKIVQEILLREGTDVQRSVVVQSALHKMPLFYAKLQSGLMRMENYLDTKTEE